MKESCSYYGTFWKIVTEVVIDDKRPNLTIINYRRTLSTPLVENNNELRLLLEHDLPLIFLMDIFPLLYQVNIEELRIKTQLYKSPMNNDTRAETVRILIWNNKGWFIGISAFSKSVT